MHVLLCYVYFGWTTPFVAFQNSVMEQLHLHNSADTTLFLLGHVSWQRGNYTSRRKCSLSKSIVSVHCFVEEAIQPPQITRKCQEREVSLQLPFSWNVELQHKEKTQTNFATKKSLCFFATKRSVFVNKPVNWILQASAEDLTVKDLYSAEENIAFWTILNGGESI